jgi:hypothetical protein
MQQREEQKFWAIWELSCRVTLRMQRQRGEGREQHTILLVEKPLSERYRREHEYLGAFWVCLDGFEAYYYARASMSEVRGFRGRFAPLHAPEEQRFLLALTAAHYLYPDLVERSFPIPLRIERKSEQVRQDILWLSIPLVPDGGVYHPYTQHRIHWLVTLGEASCEIVCYKYVSHAYWLGGQCWQGRIENWCYMPAAEAPIEVYSRPGKLQVK